MERGPTNPYLVDLIEKMSRDKKKFWKRVAFFLSKPRRARVEVNIDKIDKYSKEGEVIVVPGKVLGNGYLTKSVIVVAFNFSKSAKEKIESAGGKVFYLNDYYEKEKDVSNHKIII